MIFGIRKQVMGLSCGVVCVITFSRFDTIPECDRHTHRHTTTAYTVLSIGPSCRAVKMSNWLLAGMVICLERSANDFAV